MCVRPVLIAKVLLCACCLVLSNRALTLDEIQKSPSLTPGMFAGFFAHFEYKFHHEVQSAETFLASQSGDCDDYAILAARVLRAKGYTPRLVTVRMPHIVHVVCYIQETGSYLD